MSARRSPALLLVVASCAGGCDEPGAPGSAPSTSAGLGPRPQYQRYIPGLGGRTIEAEALLRPTDPLPKSLQLGAHTVVVSKVEIAPGARHGHLMAYVTLDVAGRRGRTGFWHPGNVSEASPDNACYDLHRESYVCGGILTVAVRSWTEGGTTHQREVYLGELDYDAASHRWGYAKLVLSHYSETPAVQVGAPE